jgi:hypothetical protein
MPAGQVLNIVVCASGSPGAGAGQVAGPFSFQGCPAGQDAYVVQSYVPYASSQTFIDGLMSPFDTSVAGGIFGFGFGVVVFFYLLGLKGSVLVRPFFGGLR